jgi:hypothetical protein
MNFSVSAALAAINFSSIMNFTKIIERIDVDAARLGVSATRLYAEYHTDHLGYQTWAEWAIDWGKETSLNSSGFSYNRID